MLEAPTVCNEENWRDIPGYNGRYQASSLGRIKSVGHPRRINNVFIMKPQPRGAGNYLGVGLFRPELGKQRYVYIHTLIALTFLGSKPDGMQVNHIDLDKHNNAVTNLEYASPRDNTRHALARGVKRSAGKGRCLTPDEVREIRQSGPALNNRQLAERYGVSHETVRMIRLGRRWEYLHDGSPLLSEHQRRILERRKTQMTPDLVRIVRQRALIEDCQTIGDDYGYSRTGIHDIVIRKTWKHVE